MSRKARKARITVPVTELIAAGNSWVYATRVEEQDLFRDVATRINEDKLMETLAAPVALPGGGLVTLRGVSQGIG